ncbi:hypothetical protein P691DRAFT_674773, partial [Macrolepiota fuliginosa MF-IS2]
QVFLTSLLALTMAQAAGPRTCYPAGAGPASSCAQFIIDFCADAASKPIRIGDSKSRCYNLPNGNRCDLIAYNSLNAFAPPSEINCRTVLNDVARRCRAGGFGKINSGSVYTFTVDPNSGRCATGVQGGS